MSWIRTIPYDEADGRLRALYDRIRGPNGEIDNIMLCHGLRPHTLEGHMTLYKNVLHHRANALPRWLLEALGVYVSRLNGCTYCVDHHSAGLRRLLADESRADALLRAIETEELAAALRPAEVVLFRYARALTLRPAEVDRSLVEAMREAGWSDGEILEVNQLVAYFAYANRTVLGLGVTTEGDVLGLAPTDSERPEDWHHR